MIEVLVLQHRRHIKIIEGLRSRVGKPTKVTLHPPNMGVSVKCVSEDADHSRLWTYAHRVGTFLIHFGAFQAISSI